MTYYRKRTLFQKFKYFIHNILYKLNVCSCGRKATWIYMPDNDWWNSKYCDNCVPRGCLCTKEYVLDYNYIHSKGDIYNNNLNNPLKDNKFIWLDDAELTWTYIDEKGRQYPCCEFISVEF